MGSRFLSVILAAIAATSASRQPVPVYELKSNSTLRVRRAALDVEADAISVSIRNTGATDQTSVTMRGFGFRNGELIGGFSLIRPVTVSAHGFVEIRAEISGSWPSRADALVLTTAPIPASGGAGRLRLGDLRRIGVRPVSPATTR